MKEKKGIYFVVYRYGFHNQYASAGVQGGGYYGGYKDKLSDYWYDDINLAKKYKSLGVAITRLGVYVTKIDTKLSDVSALEIDYDYINRNRIINEVIGEKGDDQLIDAIRIKTGYIEYYKNGVFMGRADQMVIDYIKNILTKNAHRIETENKLFGDYVSDNSDFEEWFLS